MVPFVFATASAIVGKKVRATIGRPLLNVNSWTHGAAYTAVRAVRAGKAEERGTAARHGGIVGQALGLRVVSVERQAEACRSPPRRH